MNQPSTSVKRTNGDNWTVQMHFEVDKSGREAVDIAINMPSNGSTIADMEVRAAEIAKSMLEDYLAHAKKP